jgi:hypothetical protein
VCVECLAVVGLGAGRRCVSVVAATPVRHLRGWWVWHRDRELTLANFSS